MKRHFGTLVFATLTSIAAYGCGTHEWQPREMNSRVGRSVEAELKPDSPFCLAAQCTFDLHYFFGKKYDGPDPDRKPNPNRETDPDRKIILFIPGGPGEIVDRENPYLDYLSSEQNIVYFDVRGTGFSTIPESNQYDQFLRAKYVVEDIETLRKKLFKECSIGETPIETQCQLGIRPWDAIYAHSWGTIVAQRYAAAYPKMVKKLILSAPVSRAHDDTQPARRKMIVENLIDIFQRHRTSSCYWSNDDPLVKQPQSLSPELTGLDNFCFLSDVQISFIRHAFSKFLSEIETDYASVNLVDTFYDEFKSDRDSGFWLKYPYQEEFFNAIRQLGDLGAGQHQAMRFDRQTRQMKISAAFYLGYYLMLPKQALTDRQHPLYPGNEDSFHCKPEAEFFKRIQDTESDRLRRNFCVRVKLAWIGLNRRIPSNNQSSRARSVLGVFDGLTRWIFEIMKGERRLDDKGCFRGKDLQDLATGDPELQKGVLTSKVVREQARKLGTPRNEEICPWDPALRHRHDVKTLILKGDSDNVTAGGQAEYLFEKGLKPGNRVLIEFPGSGHLMSLQVRVPTEMRDEGIPAVIDMNRSQLIRAFLTNASIVEFSQDTEVKEVIKAFGGCLRTESDNKCTDER